MAGNFHLFIDGVLARVFHKISDEDGRDVAIDLFTIAENIIREIKQGSSGAKMAWQIIRIRRTLENPG